MAKVQSKAKVQPKTKATTKAKAKATPKTQPKDPLQVSLDLLSLADQEGREALRHLCAAIQQKVTLPKIVPVKFRIDKTVYKGKVTADHAAKIYEASESYDDVLGVVNALLGAESKVIAGDIYPLDLVLENEDKAGKPTTGIPKAGTKPVVLGCCVYPGGQTPNLTQTQCSQYTNSTWESGNGDCRAAKP